jgi:predicted PurR-regulated permease PerM
MTREGRSAALLFVGVAAAVVVAGALPFAAGIVGAPALAALGGPMQRRLSRHIASHVSALLLVIAAWVCVTIPVGWLAVIVIRQAPTAIEQVHRAAERLPKSAMIGTMPADSVVAQAAAKSWQLVTGSVGPALGAGARVMTDLSIALLGLYFLLMAGDKWWRTVREWLPFSPEGSDSLRDVFSSVTRSTVFGSLTSAIVQGASIGVGLWLTGNDAPAFWGAVAAFCTLVPVVGNALVWVPAIVVTIVHHDYRATATMAIFGKLLPEILDRVIKTRIARRLSNTHPLITLLGVLIGAHLFGPIGVVVGPALLQCTLAIVSLYRREYGVAR